MREGARFLVSSRGAAEIGTFLDDHRTGFSVVAAARNVFQIGAGDADETRAGGESDGVDGAVLEDAGLQWGRIDNSADRAIWLQA